MITLSALLAALAITTWTPQVDPPVAFMWQGTASVCLGPQRCSTPDNLGEVPVGTVLLNIGTLSDRTTAVHYLAHEVGHLLYGSSESQAEAYACEYIPANGACWPGRTLVVGPSETP